MHCLDFFVAVPGLDGTIPAPARAIKVAFGDVEVPYAVGGPSVAVPGTPNGVATLHSAYGRLPWSEIVTPARDLAAAGAPFPLQHAELLPDVAAAMVLGDGVAVYSRPDGDGGRRTLAGGELLHHEGLADTLDDYLNFGPDALTTGPRGRALVAAVRADGGALSEEDMARYRVEELPVHKVRFGPGVICVRGNDLDAFGRTAAGVEPAPAPHRAGGSGPQPGAVAPGPGGAHRDDDRGRRGRAGQRLRGNAFARPRIGHLDRRGARQLDARRG